MCSTAFWMIGRKACRLLAVHSPIDTLSPVICMMRSMTCLSRFTGRSPTCSPVALSNTGSDRLSPPRMTLAGMDAKSNAFKVYAQQTLTASCMDSTCSTSLMGRLSRSIWLRNSTSGTRPSGFGRAESGRNIHPSTPGGRRSRSSSPPARTRTTSKTTSGSSSVPNSCSSSYLTRRPASTSPVSGS